MFTAFWLFIVGVCLGSFVNALVWRLRYRKDWVRGRSECVHCHHTLAALDLVPIISWLALRGRCRYCRKPISAQYPIVEGTVGIVYTGSFIFWPYEFDTEGTVRLVFWLIGLIILAALFLYDLRWMKFPTSLLYALIGLGVTQTLLIGLVADAGAESILKGALVGALIGGGIFHVIYYVTKGRAIGDGDHILGYGFGLLLGSGYLAWLAITVGAIIGSIVSLFLMSKGVSSKTKIPFGPFLIAGVVIAGIFGPSILKWLGVLSV